MLLALLCCERCKRMLQEETCGLTFHEHAGEVAAPEIFKPVCDGLRRLLQEGFWQVEEEGSAIALRAV